jgi:hypothetical protein
MGGLRCQAIQTEHGPYTAERTQKAVYTVRCLWFEYLQKGIRHFQDYANFLAHVKA